MMTPLADADARQHQRQATIYSQPPANTQTLRRSAYSRSFSLVHGSHCRGRGSLGLGVAPHDGGMWVRGRCQRMRVSRGSRVLIADCMRPDALQHRPVSHASSITEPNAREEQPEAIPPESSSGPSLHHRSGALCLHRLIGSALTVREGVIPAGTRGSQLIGDSAGILLQGTHANSSRIRQVLLLLPSPTERYCNSTRYLLWLVSVLARSCSLGRRRQLGLPTAAGMPAWLPRTKIPLA